MDGDDDAAGSTAATAFSYASNVPLLKYYIVTPHVHAGRSVGDTTQYSDATYNTIRSQADSATTASFVAIAGQEVSTISSGGHWNLFNASAMVGSDYPDGDWNDSNNYYEHVTGLGAGEMISRHSSITPPLVILAIAMFRTLLPILALLPSLTPVPTPPAETSARTAATWSPFPAIRWAEFSTNAWTSLTTSNDGLWQPMTDERIRAVIPMAHAVRRAWIGSG